MGFKKWLLKHGPGSIGATAKAISKTYIRIKKSNPQASQDELLLLTLKTRMMGRRIAGYTSFAPEEQKEWIGKTEVALEREAYPLLFISLFAMNIRGLHEVCFIASM